jgi:hypothetical protein
MAWAVGFPGAGRGFAEPRWQVRREAQPPPRQAGTQQPGVADFKEMAADEKVQRVGRRVRAAQEADHRIGFSASLRRLDPEQA